MLALTLTAGCAHVPDTTLRQDPPAVAFTALQHPFDGARLAVDPQTQAARWQRANSADWLDPITEQPQARWLNGFVDLDDVPTYLATSRKQRALPVLVAYAIPNRGCSNYREGLPYGDYDRATPRPDSYAAWIGELVNRLGPTHAVVVLEPDALPADCFDDERAATLKGAVDDLTSAGHHVYIDAGHSSWRPSGEIAQRLLRSGVDRAEGVSLNVSNRYPTWSVADLEKSCPSSLVAVTTSSTAAATGRPSPGPTRLLCPTTGATAPTRRWVCRSWGRRTRLGGRTWRLSCGSSCRGSRTATPLCSRSRTATARPRFPACSLRNRRAS